MKQSERGETYNMGSTRATRPTSTAKHKAKLAGLLVVPAITLGVGAFAAGSTGLFAQFSDTGVNNFNSEAGTVRLQAGETVTGTVSDNLTNLEPGVSTGGSPLEFKNTGSLQFGVVDAAYTATGSLVDSPAPTATYTVRSDTGTPTTVVGTGGTPATVSVESCTAIWNGDTCTGTRKVELAPGTYSTRTRYHVTAANGLMPGTSIYLKTFYALPAKAGQEYNGATLNASYEFTAWQRDAAVTNGQQGY